METMMVMATDINEEEVLVDNDNLHQGLASASSAFQIQILRLI
jgi:hypothetical protein